jgi:hypothetical protein
MHERRTHADRRADAAARCRRSRRSAGRRPIEEPITEEDYYVRNETSSAIDLFATDLSDAGVMLLAQTVEAESSAHIFHAVEGTGGHALPSNFFASFVLMQNGRRLYEGVRDEDWAMEGGDLVLIIEADAEPPSIGCIEDTECQIRDTHPQCCSTFPICVHMTEPEPLTLDCPLGHSICDVQPLQRCECVDNVCTAVYGDAGTP